DLIISGDTSAEEVRDGLNDIATSIIDEMHRENARHLSFDDGLSKVQSQSQPSTSEPLVLDRRWVYAVSSEADPKAIKIGVAQDISKRLRALQMGSASPIELRWSARGGFPLERHLHASFNKKRISGEWFDFRQVTDPVKAISAAARGFLADYPSADQ
ncbi:GIY-YIG nuclease family protein, partial [Bacillus velezensis]|uniref:GIY-YIG nuclease family protein n=2 Tax=Bacillati TaxID=1783272 RepID=UPI0035E2EDA5